ncbi:hypothetical protein [Sphingomonas sp. 3-13AW]|uniref:hypothetical protein n=1 Tax=Sphingomonas sp. 3-13AW TaxID=3050450 RepID=UPI003BB78C60
METYGFTHATVSKSSNTADFLLLIHASRADVPQSEPVLIATVDDDRPMLATRILRMLRFRGLSVQAPDLELNIDEPDISFLTLRASLHEDGSEWTDLEVRYVDGQKTASASFPEQYEAFAYGMLDLFGPKEPAYRRFAMFSYWEYEASGGWNDFVECFDTVEQARSHFRWTTAANHSATHVEIVDLSTMTSVEEKVIPARHS